MKSHGGEWAILLRMCERCLSKELGEYLRSVDPLLPAFFLADLGGSAPHFSLHPFEPP
jgi:hypothetical protein